jgi:hypothetical protein
LPYPTLIPAGYHITLAGSDEVDIFRHFVDI